MKKPNLFVIGAPKTGTTALHNFLSQHSEIYMSPVKEIGYFCSDFHKKSDFFHKKKIFFKYRTRKDYLSLFRAWGNEKFAGEASTHYFHSLDSPKNIFKFNPGSKIILILREPSSHLISYHWELYNSKIETERDFKKALKNSEFKEKGLKKISHKVRYPDLTYYWRVPLNYSSVARYYNYFSSNNILVITFEEFKKDNLKTYKKIETFLNIDTSFKPKFKNINSRFIYRSYFFKKIVESRFLWYFPKKILPVKIYMLIKEKIISFNKTSVSVPEIDPKLKNKIIEYYYEDVRKISNLTGVDLINIWRYNSKYFNN